MLPEMSANNSVWVERTRSPGLTNRFLPHASGFCYIVLPSSIVLPSWSEGLPDTYSNRLTPYLTIIYKN
jgi:hypothetical protein